MAGKDEQPPAETEDAATEAEDAAAEVELAAAAEEAEEGTAAPDGEQPPASTDSDAEELAGAPGPAPAEPHEDEGPDVEEGDEYADEPAEEDQPGSGETAEPDVTEPAAEPGTTEPDATDEDTEPDVGEGEADDDPQGLIEDLADDERLDDALDAAPAIPSPRKQADSSTERQVDKSPKNQSRSVRFWGASPAGLLIGLLLALLGFGLVVQLQNNTSNGLAGRRQDDLVRILDDLTSREERLRQQLGSLTDARARLDAGGNSSQAALDEATRRATELGILAGTLPAQGPGIVLTVSDPQHGVRAEDLLDAIEELRGAGAEAMQVGRVRIGLSSAFTQDTLTSPVLVDGTQLTAPYQIYAIGDPPTMATAMNIPGGVVDTIGNRTGSVAIQQRPHLVISVLRQVKDPQYAQPAPSTGN